MDPDPGDTTYETVYAFILRERDGSPRVAGDHHVEGLFWRAEWAGMFRGAGLAAESRMDPGNRDIFTAKPVLSVSQQNPPL